MARGDAVARFTGERPSLDSYWRALILFGRNVASYKFALGQSILELSADGHDFVTLDELADPFSRHLCRHLATVDRQSTSSKSRFLDACRARNAGTLDADELIDTTVRLGFNNVIDAFHILDGAEVPRRFFVDERRTSGGIRLTEEVHRLVGTGERESLFAEADSRWSLVEAAWELNLPSSLLTVSYDAETQSLRASDQRRRTAITRARDALNGYQKGACFYCYGAISVVPSGPDFGQVDHCFAWSTGVTVGGAPVDGVWNLVLACQRCNGWHEKGARPPHARYVERLHRRNEYLISSQHPLRPTLIAQTGETRSDRRRTLRRAYDEVTVGGARNAWLAPEELIPRFWRGRGLPDGSDRWRRAPLRHGRPGAARGRARREELIRVTADVLGTRRRAQGVRSRLEDTVRRAQRRPSVTIPSLTKRRFGPYLAAEARLGQGVQVEPTVRRVLDCPVGEVEAVHVDDHSRGFDRTDGGRRDDSVGHGERVP